MENQSKLDKAVKISIIVGALIVALSIAYYLVVFLPQKEEARLNQQRQEQQFDENEVRKAEGVANVKKRNLATCLFTADSEYWAYVKLNGTEKKDGTVYADNDVWDRAESTKQSKISNCHRLHQ